MEISLVRAIIEKPDYLAPVEADRLRYAFGLVRLTRFAPGAAARSAWRDDVEIDPDLVSPLREILMKRMKPALRKDSAEERLKQTARQLQSVIPLL